MRSEKFRAIAEKYQSITMSVSQSRASSNKKCRLFVETSKAQKFPLVTSFPLVPPGANEVVKIFATSKQTNRGSQKVTLSGKNTDTGVNYKGTSQLTNGMTRSAAEQALKNSCNFAVGVYDESSNMMKLIMADQAHVLRPHFEIIESSEPSRLTVMTHDERKSSLTQEFGSRKKKRALQAAKSNTISKDSISGADAIENTFILKDNTELSSVVSSSGVTKEGNIDQNTGRNSSSSHDLDMPGRNDSIGGSIEGSTKKKVSKRAKKV